MLSQTDLERERYESRRKAQLDYNTGLKVARIEGLEEGLAEGRAEGRAEATRAGLVDVIHFCEDILHRSQTPRERLDSLTMEDLTAMADELRSHVRRQE